MSRELALLMAQVSALVETAARIRAFIDPHAVHVVIPDPKLGRGPWVEVRLTMPAAYSAQMDLEEQVEHAWPGVEFEFTYVEEGDL